MLKPKEAALLKVAKVNSQHLFKWLQDSRARCGAAGATSQESFIAVYYTLITMLVSGAIAYDLSEADLHELINDTYSEGVKTLKGKAEAEAVQ